MKTHFKPALAAVVLALTCASAARADDQPPARDPDVVGTINQVLQDRITVGIGKKAVARLTSNTRILTDRPLRRRLEAGMKVKIWLEAPGSDAALIIQVVQLPGREAGRTEKAPEH